MKDKTRIIFRADGNSRIGLGHVVRSLALAEMLHKDFECVFAIQAPSTEIQKLIKQTCDGVIILPECAPDEDRFIHELEAYIGEDIIVVLDGYSFGEGYQKIVKGRGALLVCIDDIHAYPFTADIVINQAGGVDASSYRTASYTKLLLGPAYALLRAPFLINAKKSRSFPKAELKVFLNLGGADPQNHTLSIAKELEQNASISQIEIVLGSAYKHLDELENWLLGKQSFRLHQDLEAGEMAKLMQSCPVAITSASGVAYEYASVGGLLFIVQTADNQAGLYSFLVKNGLAQPYPQLSQLQKDSLKSVFKAQVSKQREYFDGKSDERLQALFHGLALQSSIIIREATEQDLMLLFDWANDPEVRKRSFNPNPILLESHTRWLNSKLNSTQTALYIAEANGAPAAHIRFELEDDKATISYLIGSDHRGKGLGHVILQKGVRKLLKQHNTDLSVIEGLVQKDNFASIRAFEKAGFNNGKPDTNHPEAHRFVLQTDSLK